MDIESIPSNVREAFDKYPASARKRLLALRRLIFEVAAGDDEIGRVTETLKWGFPSYLTKKGSTIRLGFKQSEKMPYAIFFNCNTRLVDTFTDIYGDLFNYEGNRAIRFSATHKLPRAELKHCISLALRYHRVKHLPLLGA